MKINFKILKPAASFHGVGYSDRKQSKGTAKLIYFENFGHLQDGRQSVTKKEFEDYLSRYSKRNSRTRKPQFHAVMTCRGNECTDEQLKENAIKVMEELGYKDVPILMYSHNDTKNTHIHIVTSRIARDGTKITHDMEGVRANKILNILLNNNPVENLKNDIELALSYHFTTAAQFYLLLEKKEYDIKINDDNIFFYKHGAKQGELEKSILFDRIASNKLLPTYPAQLKALLYKYATNYSSVLKKFDNLHYTTEKMKYGSDLTNFLKENFGYDFVFFNSKTGAKKPFGYAIIDHRNKTVYKGSEVMKLDKLVCLNTNNQQAGLPTKQSLQRQEVANLPFDNNSEKDVSANDEAAGIQIEKLFDVVETLLEGKQNIQSSAGENPKRKRKRKNNFF